MSASAGPSSSSDYLIPMTNPRSENDGGGSVANLTDNSNRQDRCGYWETSFTREGVKAIARGDLPAGTPSEEAPLNSTSLGDLRSSGSNKRRSAKNYATEALNLTQSQSSQPLLDTPPDSPTVNDMMAAGAVIPPPPDLLNQTQDGNNLYRKSYANVRIAPGSNTALPVSTKADSSTKLEEISC